MVALDDINIVTTINPNNMANADIRAVNRLLDHWNLQRRTNTANIHVDTLKVMSKYYMNLRNIALEL